MKFLILISSELLEPSNTTVWLFSPVYGPPALAIGVSGGVVPSPPLSPEGSDSTLNKYDLFRNQIHNIVRKERVERVTKIINYETLSKYKFGSKSMITSAKTGEGVNQAFKQLAIQILSYRRFKMKI